MKIPYVDLGSTSLLSLNSYLSLAILVNCAGPQFLIYKNKLILVTYPPFGTPGKIKGNNQLT